MSGSGLARTEGYESAGNAAGFSARATPDNDALLKPEQLLQEADTVLEKDEDVLDILKDYLRAGGRVQTAVSHLSDGYLGKLSTPMLLLVAFPSAVC
jgi:hypothetical protein